MGDITDPVPFRPQTFRPSGWDCKTSGCTLSGGEQVLDGWSGNGSGENSCNTCSCEWGTLTCTEMACGSTATVGKLPNDADSDDKSSLDKVGVIAICAVGGVVFILAISFTIWNQRAKRQKQDSYEIEGTELAV